MRTLLLVVSMCMVVASAANADWGRPGPGHGPGFGGPGHGGPGFGGPGHGGPGRPGPGWGRPVPPPQRYETTYIDCSSGGYRLNYCMVPGRVVGVQVVRQDSMASCRIGDSVGYQNNAIWVDKGCRGQFAVSFIR